MRARTASAGTAIATLALSGWIAAGAAVAGDLAQPELIGFSHDGRFVAFEEYGIQDGSGFPYSSIYVVDVAANDWVDGSPVRVMIDDDDMPEEQMMDDGLEIARRQAMDAAAPVLQARGIVAGNTGLLLIHHPSSDLDAPEREVRMSLGAALNPYWAQDRQLLRLTERQVPAADCEAFGEPTVIFTLELLPEGGAPITLQRDRRLFDSRGCPIGYRIHSVVVYFPGLPNAQQCCPGDETALLVLVQMTTPGFEGHDWRFLGVTGLVHGLL